MKNNTIAMIMVCCLTQTGSLFASDASNQSAKEVRVMQIQRNYNTLLACSSLVITIASAGITTLSATRETEDPRQKIVTGLTGLHTAVWGFVTMKSAFMAGYAQGLLDNAVKNHKQN